MKPQEWYILQYLVVKGEKIGLGLGQSKLIEGPHHYVIFLTLSSLRWTCSLNVLSRQNTAQCAKLPFLLVSVYWLNAVVKGLLLSYSPSKVQCILFATKWVISWLRNKNCNTSSYLQFQHFIDKNIQWHFIDKNIQLTSSIQCPNFPDISVLWQ